MADVLDERVESKLTANEKAVRTTCIQYTYSIYWMQYMYDIYILTCTYMIQCTYTYIHDRTHIYIDVKWIEKVDVGPHLRPK